MERISKRDISEDHARDLARGKRMIEQAAHATLFSNGKDEITVPQPVIIRSPSGALPSLDNDADLRSAATRLQLGRESAVDKSLAKTAKKLGLSMQRAVETWMQDQMTKRWQEAHPGAEVPDEILVVEWAIESGYHVLMEVNPDDPPNIKRYVMFRTTETGKERVVGLELNLEDFELVQ
jgi:hypothetical protein